MSETKVKAESVKELKERLAAVYSRTPVIVSEVEQRRVNLQRLLVLGGMAVDNPLWQTLLSYADEHARNEREMALRPGLSDGDRQYSAGRAASAEDFCCALRDLRLKAEREAQRLKE